MNFIWKNLLFFIVRPLNASGKVPGPSEVFLKGGNIIDWAGPFMCGENYFVFVLISLHYKKCV